MRCNGKGEWKQEEQRVRPGVPPCTDDPKMKNKCPAERGHCLQFTQKGAKMDSVCPRTCGIYYSDYFVKIFYHLHLQILVMVAIAKTTTSGTCTALTGYSTVTVQGGLLNV